MSTLLVALLLAVAPQDPAEAVPGPPAGPPSAIARIPVRIVHGKLVVACQISARKRIAANLFVDYDAPVGLLLHNGAGAGIVAENDDGTPNVITVHLPDLNLQVDRREFGDEEFFNRFTKWWSAELGENPVVGTLGAKALARYHVVFDLDAGFLELSAPHPAGQPAPEPPPGVHATPLSLRAGLVWFPVAYGVDRAGAMALATSNFDTRVDEDLCAELGRPAGDLGAVRIADFDLARYVPLRPERSRHAHPDGAFGTSGLDLLLHFRVEVDRARGVIWWQETRPPEFPQAEQDYYFARERDDAEALEAWLDAHPEQRLAEEAATRLLQLRMDEGADAETMRAALGRLHATRPADLKATGALELMGEMLQTGRPDAALLAGEFGVEHGRTDRYPEAAYQLHARLGQIRLRQNELDAAWKHLLSAAFGLPEDGPVNLALAKVYQRQERWSRAFSRYLQAVLAPETAAEAMLGMERVWPLLPDAESFSVDAVERLLEGRVEAFGVATEYLPEDGVAPSRRVALEWWTNAHLPFGIGAGLARDGLREHFGAEWLTAISYHGLEPELDPLANEFSVWMCATFAKGGARHAADGVLELPTAARSRFKQEVYEVCLGAVLSRLGVSSEFQIEVSASGNAEELRGRAGVRGPASSGLFLQIILCERSVLFPGRSGVIFHRNVARASLTDALEGADYAPVDGGMAVDFARRWQEIEQVNFAYLDRMAAEGRGRVPRIGARLQPRQSVVVVLLRERASGRILQSSQTEVAFEEDAG